MSKYQRHHTKSIEFDGDTVVVQYTGMKRGHFQQLSARQDSSIVDDGGDVKLSFGSQMEMLDVMSDIAQDCVVSVSGLYDSGGSPVPLEEIFSEAYFFGLVADIATSVIESSFLTKEDQQKIKKPPTVQRRVVHTDVGLTDSVRAG
jgi:hypothetical protein